MDSNYGYIRATFNDTYDNNMDCEWRVTTPVQYPIHFYFESFDLEHSADCGFDYLELEDLAMPGHNLTGLVVGLVFGVLATYSPSSLLWLHLR